MTDPHQDNNMSETRSDIMDQTIDHTTPDGRETTLRVGSPWAYHDQLLALARWIIDRASHGANEVGIYAFQSVTIGGLRISEITLSNECGSMSWLRSEAKEVTLVAEDFCETLGKEPHRPGGWESYINPHGEARAALAQLLFGDEAEHKEWNQIKAEETATEAQDES